MVGSAIDDYLKVNF